MSPLPSVETTSSALQQEKAQWELLQINKLDNESFAMFSWSNTIKCYKTIMCSVCGGRGHKNDKYWDVVGYPEWHAQHGQNSNTSGPRVKPQFQTNRWATGSKQGGSKLAANAQISQGLNADVVPAFTPQQLAQLLPPLNLQKRGSDTDEELEPHFSGMMSCHMIKGPVDSWCIDFGATDHMTPNYDHLSFPISLSKPTQINLPIGATAKISHQGTVKLNTVWPCTKCFVYHLSSINYWLWEG